MMAAEIVRRVREAGAELRLGGPTGIELVRYRRLDDATLDSIQRHRDAIRAILEEQAAQTATDAVLAAQRLLRECRFPPEPAPCNFHTGYTTEPCKRCGATLAGHHGGVE